MPNLTIPSNRHFAYAFAAVYSPQSLGLGMHTRIRLRYDCYQPLSKYRTKTDVICTTVQLFCCSLFSVFKTSHSLFIDFEQPCSQCVSYSDYRYNSINTTMRWIFHSLVTVFDCADDANLNATRASFGFNCCTFLHTIFLKTSTTVFLIKPCT